MNNRRKLLFNGLLFTGFACVVVLYGLSFSQIPRRIEEQVEIGARVEMTVDTSGTGYLLGWREEACCAAKSDPPCNNPNAPPWVPDTDNPVMPYRSIVSITIISTSTSSHDEVWLESPYPILLWETAMGHEGETQEVGTFEEGETLVFMIRSGICTSQVRYPQVSGEAPVWTLHFEDWKDCDWNDVVTEVSAERAPQAKAVTIDTLWAVGIKDSPYPLYLGYFEPDGEFVEVHNRPVGDATAGFAGQGNQSFTFKLLFDFDAYPSKPSADVEVVYDIAVDGISSWHFEQTAVGWSDEVVLGYVYESPPTEDAWGDHDMDISLQFSTPGGEGLGYHDIETTYKAFLKKSHCFYEQDHEDNRLDGPVPNWYYFWKQIDWLQDSRHGAQFSYFAFDYGMGMIKSDRYIGWYDPSFDWEHYYVTQYAGTDPSTDIIESEPVCCNPCNSARGLGLFVFTCRHENWHRKKFIEWYEDWEEYLRRRTEEGEDPDGDCVPNWLEIQEGLDPAKDCSHPCGELPCAKCGSPPLERGRISTDFEYLVHKEHPKWQFDMYNYLDWAYWGKQTDPAW